MFSSFYLLYAFDSYTHDNGYFNFRVDHNSSLVLLKVSELSSATIRLLYFFPFRIQFNILFEEFNDT